MDLSDHGPECILHDFFRILPIPRDPYGEAIGSIAIRDDKMLGCRRLVLAESLHQCLVAVKSCWQASIHLIKTRASLCHGP
jgi:hypothetical protein